MRYSNSTLQDQLIWFLKVRWAAFLGHALVYFAALFVLKIDLSASMIVFVEASIALSNIALYRFRHLVRSVSAFGVVLLLDVILLTALLSAYGGHANPFSMVYLVQVVLAAFFIGYRWTWIIAIASSLCFAALFLSPASMVTEMPHHQHGSASFDLHLQGMLIAFVMLSFLIAGVVSRMRVAIDHKEHEIIRRRANEDRLAALTQLAAGAAHELGTPLSTMSVVVSEMLNDIPEGASVELKADLHCLRDQLSRCGEILRGMSAQGGELSGEMPINCSAQQVVQRVTDILPPRYKDRLQAFIEEGIDNLVVPLETVAQAVASLAKNAFEASAGEASVMLSVSADQSHVLFEVRDSGEGMDSETVRRLGEPFFTTKEPGKGTGLGIFLCRLLVSRLEGVINFDSERGRGTRVSMQLPLHVRWSAA